MNTKTWLSGLLRATIVLGLLSGCQALEAEGGKSPPFATEQADTVQTAAELELNGATVITLKGDCAEVKGGGAEAEGAIVTIFHGGTYSVSGTLQDGQIVVCADEARVILALNGADITCSYGSPLCISGTKSTTVYLMPGTQNELTDGEHSPLPDGLSPQVEDEPNACLYSKDDLVIQGSGALTVQGNYKNGIVSKDTLEICDSTLYVSAARHGITGKDSGKIQRANLTVVCGGDGLRSTQDTDKALGWMEIENSTLDLTCGGNGIQTETFCTITGGVCEILAGGGAGENSRAKGITAGGDLTLRGGVFTMNCADDAFYANGGLAVSDIVCTVSAGDDALHANETLTVYSGTLDVYRCHEGLEAPDIDLVDGEISIFSEEDGVNAGGTPVPGQSQNRLRVSGGTITILAGGDALDSNGSLSITGGTLALCGMGASDGALDAKGSLDIAGGVVFAATGGTAPQAPDNPSQCTLQLTLNRPLEAGNWMQFSGDNYRYVFQLTGQADSVTFSAPELAGGAMCTVSYGGTYSGKSENGLCSGGLYAGGTEERLLSLHDGLNRFS